MSRDVRFFEHILPYKIFSTPTTTVPHPHPSITITSSSDIPSSPNIPNVFPCPGSPPASAPSVPTAPAPVRQSSCTYSKPSWHSDYAILTHLSSHSPTKLHPTVNAPISASYSCFLTHSLHTKDPLHYKHVVTQPQ